MEFSSDEIDDRFSAVWQQLKKLILYKTIVKFTATTDLYNVYLELQLDDGIFIKFNCNAGIQCYDSEGRKKLDFND